MSRNKNKKARKLQNYRDKLLVRVTNLEGAVRHYVEIMDWVRKCLQLEDYLRAYALASEPDDKVIPNDILRLHVDLKEFIDKNEIAKELALAYRMLNVERQYTKQIQVAAHQRDYLRVAALCAEQVAEAKAHDQMLSRWSQDHGFKYSMKKEMEDEDII
jgi:hypothetical protein